MDWPTDPIRRLPGRIRGNRYGIFADAICFQHFPASKFEGPDDIGPDRSRTRDNVFSSGPRVGSGFGLAALRRLAQTEKPVSGIAVVNYIFNRATDKPGNFCHLRTDLIRQFLQ